jgi:hypothetical protein
MCRRRTTHVVYKNSVPGSSDAMVAQLQQNLFNPSSDNPEIKNLGQ